MSTKSAQKSSQDRQAEVFEACQSLTESNPKIAAGEKKITADQVVALAGGSQATAQKYINLWYERQNTPEKIIQRALQLSMGQIQQSADERIKAALDERDEALERAVQAEKERDKANADKLNAERFARSAAKSLQEAEEKSAKADAQLMKAASAQKAAGDAQRQAELAHASLDATAKKLEAVQKEAEERLFEQEKKIAITEKRLAELAHQFDLQLTALQKETSQQQKALSEATAKLEATSNDIQQSHNQAISKADDQLTNYLEDARHQLTELTTPIKTLLTEWTAQQAGQKKIEDAILTLQRRIEEDISDPPPPGSRRSKKKRS